MKSSIIAAAVIICMTPALYAQRSGGGPGHDAGGYHAPGVPRTYRSRPEPGYYRAYNRYSYGSTAGYLWPNYVYPYGGYSSEYTYSPQTPVYDPYYHNNMSQIPAGGKGINVSREEYYSNPSYRDHIDKLEAQGYPISSWY